MSRKTNNQAVLNYLSKAIKLLSDDVPKEVARVNESLATEAVDQLQGVIMTSGTGWVGKGARAVPEGRIDTGEMYDNIKAEKTPRGTFVVGWGNRIQDYYKKQEYGFTFETWSGEMRNVPAMNAFAHTNHVMEDRVQAATDDLNDFIQRGIDAL